MFAALRARAAGALGKPSKPGKYTTKGPAGGGRRRGNLPGNGHPVVAWVYGPDVHAMRAASLGAYTNTISPAARGVHRWPDRSPSGFTGDPGYGVNRFAGETVPVQAWYGLVAPLAAAQAKSKRLGANYGVSGQPGLPSTGNDAGGLTQISYAGYGGINTAWGA